MSMPLSHFVPAYPSPSPCPQVHSLCCLRLVLRFIWHDKLFHAKWILKLKAFIPEEPRGRTGIKPLSFKIHLAWQISSPFLFPQLKADFSGFLQAPLLTTWLQWRVLVDSLAWVLVRTEWSLHPAPHLGARCRGVRQVSCRSFSFSLWRGRVKTLISERGCKDWMRWCI